MSPVFKDFLSGLLQKVTFFALVRERWRQASRLAAPTLPTSITGSQKTLAMARTAQSPICERE